ncbi:MAG TPA: hypothetical protein VKF17_06130, partial [Isosphaeraceae bacterium]|nr:hypothetical protein [Isosphaeraceae bacterium]
MPETLGAAFADSGLLLERIFWWGRWLVPALLRHRARPRSRPGQTPSEIYRHYLEFAPLALALGRQTGVPVRARSGPPRAIADWYITVRGGSPPRRQGGPSGLPGNIVNVTFFHE